MSTSGKNQFVELEDLENYAMAQAKCLCIGKRISTKKTVKCAEKKLAVIKDAMVAATNYARKHADVPRAVEWLLDNWYIAEREGKCAISDVWCTRKLRGILGQKGILVVSAGAESLVASGLGCITAERLELFIDAYQECYCLTEAELSVFIPVLRIALICALAEACTRLLVMIDSGAAEDGLADYFNRLFTSLRFLAGFDATQILEKVNRIEQTLLLDPVSLYSAMDQQSRVMYRREISHLAEKLHQSELSLTKRIVELAKADDKHVGYYVFSTPAGYQVKHRRSTGYIGLVTLMSLSTALLLSFALDAPALSLLLLFPVSELVKNIVDYFVLKLYRPNRVSRLDFKDGIPEQGRTLCIISILLSSNESGARAASLLEEYRISNRDAGGHLLFGLLADLPDAQAQSLPSDSDAIKFASQEIEQLNTKYDGGFFLLSRERQFNAKDKRYSAWERKRGALLELCHFLRMQSSGILCISGNETDLNDIQYIITLDSDTRLCAGTAVELIGAMMHPLNKPVVDSKRGIVISGCGILQPRVSVDLKAAGQSLFTRIYAGHGGVDPYGGLTSDIYQNLYGTGSFLGKGIFDIDAYWACLDKRFPENTVLSHDLLEGAYLRCVFAGDIEFTDGYPAKITSYFDRMHRWIRGDWQSLPWVFRHVRSADGTRILNCLGDLDRWKIFDNLRRSLVPVFAFCALLLGILLDNSDFVLVAILAVLSTAAHFIIASAVTIFKNSGNHVRFHSAIISGIGGQLLQSLVRFVFLPVEAWVSLSAATTALYRMYISHKNLLTWVTAADSEKKTNNTMTSIIKKTWPALVSAILVVTQSRVPVAIAIGILWAFTPLLVVVLSNEYERKASIQPVEKLSLNRYAADIWRYFEEFLNREDNYLPPDNFQEQPAAGIAHRTSPTNIGLALLSTLAALDLGIITKENAVEVISKILDTVFKLAKWQGHLYNWYETTTLQILQPAYISSVDSGNFAGCLIALREGLLSLQEGELAARCQELLSHMSFQPLYDSKKHLFYIGWDISKGAPSEGWYDLLASEARQTSFLAIARGDIPRKHWRRLSRSLVTMDGYRGMASWTGTMFEYMMPELLLPYYKNSLMYESLKFCLFVQKRQADREIWGMSESAFFAFDHALNYQYKAHGAQRLALKRGMGKDSVMAPYASFLALSVDPKEALRNLERFEKIGAEGRYGFYEAVDFTKHRAKNENFKIVRTYMAHHLGMSLVAIDNVLKSNIMQRRFMRDREMAAFAELLQERIPDSGVVLRQLPRDIPEKPARITANTWKITLDAIDYMHPRWALLDNGAYLLGISETGQSISQWNGIALTKTSQEPLRQDCGMCFFVKCGTEVFSLYPVTALDEHVTYRAELSGTLCKIGAEHGQTCACITAFVSEHEAGECRVVELTSTVPAELELICYFEPVLARQSDYESHPSFSKLSLETQILDSAIIVTRRPRTKEQGISLAFAASCPFVYDTAREEALGRGGLASLETSLKKSPGATLGSVLDPCVMVRVPLRLQPHTTCTVCFALAAAPTPQTAAATVKRLLDVHDMPYFSRLDETARQLKLTGVQVEYAMSSLSLIMSPSPTRRVSTDLYTALSKGQEALWSLGVSGDLPVISAIVENESDVAASADLLLAHALISENGIYFDVVFHVKDGGDYRSTLRQSLLSLVKNLRLEHRLVVRGGIHFCDYQAPGADTIRAVSADIILSGESAHLPTRNELDKPVRLKLATSQIVSPLQSHFNQDNSFVFSVMGKLPYVAWSHMLANDSFGYLATDAGIGHMWHMNARENKVNKWLNDSLSTDGTEKLLIHYPVGDFSLFADNDGWPCTVTYGFGFAQWEKSICGTSYKTTAFVPRNIPVRVLLIESSEDTSMELTYYTDLVLCANMRDCVHVKTAATNDMLTAQNLYNRDFPDSIFCVKASTSLQNYTCSKVSWLHRKWDKETGVGFIPCAAAVYHAKGQLVLITGCADTDVMVALATYDGAKKCLAATKAFWNDITGRLTVMTPSEALNRYLNGWALYQTIACRILGRTSLYQSGGAYGFRDQLQDICAVLDVVPMLAHEHLLRAASHQYLEGDVQHWWHPGKCCSTGGDKGVRTRCSDDLLWLPYALCVYVESTGDKSILDLTAPYLVSPLLSDTEQERYEQPQVSTVTEPLLSHAMKALELVIARGTGRHDLCFIGSGDWNDGMNLVGAGGDGESVWLTWFVAVTAEKMARLCSDAGLNGAATRFSAAAGKLKAAAENAWDGAWYKRGYYDDGAPLGSCSSDECRIDSIAQSFAALAGADHDRTKISLNSSVKLLFNREARLVQLFEPPFSHGDKSPGYIKGYSPGFRENGGQYTHGAIWLAMGLFIVGMHDVGYEILEALLPLQRSNEVYKTEPFVLAADVYSAPGHVGRGGWTWYTGAAGWFRRVALENLLGLTIKDGKLHITPRFPSAWGGYTVFWRVESQEYMVQINSKMQVTITVNGLKYTGNDIIIDASKIKYKSENS